MGGNMQKIGIKTHNLKNIDVAKLEKKLFGKKKAEERMVVIQDEISDIERKIQKSNDYVEEVKKDLTSAQSQREDLEKQIREERAFLDQFKIAQNARMFL
ncbi:MAG: hypothetical protein LUE23_12655 [Lachnospiraceae bacterium]|nr:hypothetical protein [Lachnospiraceae bacterium]